MREQKNIERLFQEKFKDFEAYPPLDSWDNIAARLNEKKKKKRLLPIWFQLSGIAAALVILGSLIWNFQSNKNNSIIKNNNSIVSEDANAKKNIIDSIHYSVTKKSTITSTKAKASELNPNSIENNEVEKTINQNKTSNSNNLVNSKNTLVSNSKENNKSNPIEIKYKKQKRYLVNQTNKRNNSKNKNYKTNNNFLGSGNLIQNNLNNSSDKNLATNQKKKSRNNISNNIKTDKIETFFDKENTEKTLSNTTNIKENNSLDNDIISNKIIVKDSTLVEKISEKTNPLEKLLAAKENGENEDEKEKKKRNRWAISSNASPVYFNSLAEGSSLDQQFDSNEKKYATTLSYGVGGSYMITDKISIKTGINNINLSYNTNDIIYQTKLSSVENNVPAISRNINGNRVSFISKNEIQNTISGDVENYNQNNIGSLKQELSYFEIPIELSYKILDKKFGIEVIGGMSTLFLNNNTISLVTNGMEMNVGKANNLNNIHFSSNVGLGFKYNFWKNFNANFQPMFKYQINTFSENSGNFKPYFVGLYTGISFSF